MNAYIPEPSPMACGKIGILLINLGTPEAPTFQAVRPYLKEFLSDPRVVEIPGAIWWFVLNGYILNTRPRRSAEKYARIWTKEGSPLKIHTQRQATLLSGFLGEKLSPPPLVEFAMRYGSPSVSGALHVLKSKGCERILVFPLYPQYAASSTGSALDAVFCAARKMRNIPELRMIKHYCDHPAYITALASHIQAYWVREGRPDKLLMSFHGIPRSCVDKGDPYHAQCLKTAELIAGTLQLKPDSFSVSFQSRFGRAEWLKPYTSSVLEEWGRQGVARADVICPGFVSDCLETLEEIAMEGKATFMKTGGKEFHAIPCLNERPEWVRAMRTLVMENLQGWLPPTSSS